MAQISEKILAWLHNVLREYRDPRRTYSDTVQALSLYPSLSPRTEVYTHENGTAELLLIISGTIPVIFRGATYRFPLKLWLPHAYPYESPLAYVTPERDMIVRPGQHVSIDGKVYHPYLRDWSRIWDRANISEFLGVLQQVFSREPPIVSRAQQQIPGGPQPQSTPSLPTGSSGAPQLPPKQRTGGPGQVATPPPEGPSGPPPRPPKSNDNLPASILGIGRNGPPLPPLPTELSSSPVSYRAPENQNRGYHSGPYAAPSASQPQQYQSTNMHIPQKSISSSTQHAGPLRQGSNGTVFTPAQVNVTNHPPQREAHPSSFDPRIPQPMHHQQQQSYSSSPQLYDGFEHTLQRRTTLPIAQTFSAPTNAPFDHHREIPSNNVVRQPPADLLSDPFDVTLPDPSTSQLPLSGPPIPPNPEREHLLHAISQTLIQQVQNTASQNLAAVAPLQAQQHALFASKQTLEAEIRQIDLLDQVLSRNEGILHRSIRECDQTITTANSKTQPSIDEILLAPTLVATQLWTLCAEEDACRGAMYVLQRAVDKGRLNGNDLAKHMRALGRECFLKMALARKCAKGMGLEVIPAN